MHDVLQCGAFCRSVLRLCLEMRALKPSTMSCTEWRERAGLYLSARHNLNKSKVCVCVNSVVQTAHVKPCSTNNPHSRTRWLMLVADLAGLQAQRVLPAPHFGIAEFAAAPEMVMNFYFIRNSFL